MAARSRLSSRAGSTYSDDTTPPTKSSAAPLKRRGGARGVRPDSSTIDAVPSIEPVQPTRIPQHYYLEPTIPSPFFGTLEASLDAILRYGILDVATTPVKEELLRPVSTSTNWPTLLNNAFGPDSGIGSERARYLLEEFLFLVTRTLLPEQVAENRLAMGRLYDRKKQLAIRLVLRYDMTREWCLGDGPVGKRDMSIPSVPPSTTDANSSGLYKLVDSPMNTTGVGAGKIRYKRRDLMPNVWPTLIAAPPGGYTTHGVRERMKHYVTPFDDYLLLTDEEVSRWSDKWLVVRASQIVLQWQWLRQKNEKLDEMETDGWEELDGRADECEWIAEKKEGGNVKGGKNSEEL